MKPGSQLTIVSGSRLRRVSDDGKSLLDQNMHEGALVENDTTAKVVNVIINKERTKIAYVLEVKHTPEGKSDGVTLLGWCYGYEVTQGR